MNTALCQSRLAATDQQISKDFSLSYCEMRMDQDTLLQNNSSCSTAYMFGECVVRPFIDTCVCPAVDLAQKYVVHPVMDHTVCPIMNVFKQLFFPKCTSKEDERVSSEPFSEDELLQFIRENSFLEKRFASLRRDGFPFSKMGKQLVEEALTIQIEDKEREYILIEPILLAMLRARAKDDLFVPDSTSYHEMKALIQEVPFRSLVDLLENCYYGTKNHADNARGRLFHVLLKMSVNEQYPIPEERVCNPESLDYAIQECFKIDYTNHPNPSRLIELVTRRSSRMSDGSIFLPNIDHAQFDKFLIKNLMDISFEKWPDKGSVITELLETIPEKNKLNLASLLEYSTTDAKTAEVGACFKKALLAPTLRERYTHLYRLFELLPHMNMYHVEYIFHCPFPSFQEDFFTKDPPSVRRLTFNSMRHVLTFENLVIGMYETHPLLSNLEVNSRTLLAFDKITNRLTWGLPITKRIVYCEMTALGLALVYDKDPALHLIDPKTGDEMFHTTLPSLPNGKEFPYDEIHITPSGFCYYMVKECGVRVLYGGNIQTGEWKQAFKKKAPVGDFEPLGSYLRFSYNPLSLRDEPEIHTQTIISSDGAIRLFLDCQELAVKNGKVFMIKTGSSGKSQLTLAMQDVATDSAHFEVQGEKKEVPLGSIVRFSLLGVGDDATVAGLALYEERLSAEEPCFIDVLKKEISTGQHRIPSYGEKLFDEKKSAIWSWDAADKILRKQTKEGSSSEVSLESGRGTSLLHVDDDDKMYFVDIPF